MATSVEFDGTSIQSDNIKIQTIEHESFDNKELNIQRLANFNGGKLVEDTFAPKNIRLKGIIIGSSQSNLESRIDNFKKLINKREKNLDIAYRDDTRRYKATGSAIISRDYYHITFALFEVNFIVSDPPFGYTTDTSTIEYDPITQSISTWTPTASFLGTARPLPIIQITINSETDLTQIKVVNTEVDQEIKVTRAYSAGEVLIINTSDFTVTVDGTAVDYEGVFPEFVAGSNDLRISAISTAHNLTVMFIYYPFYL